MMPLLRRALLTLALVLLPAPAAAEDAEVVRLWHAYRGQEQAALEANILWLQERDPNIKVDILAVPSEAFRTKLTNAVPHDNGPDLFIAPHEAAAQWSANNIIQPAVFPAALPPSSFSDPAIEAVTYDDRVWAVPLAFKSLALFYNRDLVDRVPADLESMALLGAEVADVPFAYEVGNFYHHAAFFHAYGGRVFADAESPVDLDTEAMRQALRYVKDLVDSETVPPETDGALVANLFNTGKTAFVFNGPWFLGEIGPTINFGVAPLPDIPGTGPLRPFLTVESLYRAARSKASDRAVAKVIAAVAGLEGSVVRATVGRQVVALEPAHDDPRVARDTTLGAFVAQARAAVPMPNRPEMGAVWEPANRALRAVVRGSSVPTVASARAQQEVGFYLRPPPPPSSPGPYLVLLALLLLGGAMGTLHLARRSNLVARVRASKHAYMYLLPASLGMIAVVFVPFLVGSAVSLFAHKGGEFTFVGLKNFARILQSSDYPVTDPMSFWFTLVVTVAWTLGNVALHTGIGLGLALLLRDPWMKLKGIYRVLLIVPWAVPNYITALIWKGMFNRQFGAVNGVLDVFGIEPVSWFSNFFTAFAANLTTNTWLGFPFMMVVTLGALQAIPRDLTEAAEVDGASAWERFRHITLPLLRPALLPAVILGSVWTFNMFNIIYLVSAGEPGGSTEILISEAYKWAFTRQAQYGYASAYSLLIFGILIVYTLLTKKVTEAGAPA